MRTSDKQIIRNLSSQLKTNGIRHIVFSPGSRNAPFAIALDNDSYFKTHVIHDERVAGFYALGISQTLNEPVALCCTSGSAVVNYFPAITEAFYRKIPLLILSADRPKALINKGHGQTIMQDDIFGKHVLKSHSFDDNSANNESNNEIIQNILNHLFKAPRGPIHLNFHLNEPLYGSEDIATGEFKTAQIRINESRALKVNNELLESLNGKKILVLCGQDANVEGLNRALSEFNQSTNVVILNENTSGLYDSNFINCIDRTLNAIDFDYAQDFIPDILITIGDAVISKRIKAFFIKNAPKTHIAINHSDIGIDMFLRLDVHLKINPAHFFESINKKNIQTNNINFESKWKSIDFAAKDRIEEFYTIENSNTDIQVFHLINQYIENKTVIHMANSSVVRYMQLFDPIKTVQYFANRGTSGIDGSMSTAVGSAISQPSQIHLFISGDISFIYDSNAMWVTPFPSNLKIILIDNSGGGIFRIIDGPRTSDQLENYFEAHHKSDVKKIAEGFGFTAKVVSDHQKFENELIDFFQNDITQILIFKTNRTENPLALNRLFKFLKNA